jgi:hypothetical protein
VYRHRGGGPEGVVRLRRVARLVPGHRPRRRHRAANAAEAQTVLWGPRCSRVRVGVCGRCTPVPVTVAPSSWFWVAPSHLPVLVGQYCCTASTPRARLALRATPAARQGRTRPEAASSQSAPVCSANSISLPRSRPARCTLPAPACPDARQGARPCAPARPPRHSNPSTLPPWCAVPATISARGLGAVLACSWRSVPRCSSVLPPRTAGP